MYSIKRICTAQTKAESYLSSATHGMSDEDSGSLQRTPNSTRRGRSAVRTSPNLGQCRSEFGQKQPRRQAGPEKKSDKRSSAGAKISVPLTLAPAGQKIWSDFHQAVPKIRTKPGQRGQKAVRTETWQNRSISERHLGVLLGVLSARRCY